MTETPAPTDTPTPTATLTPSPEPTLEASPTPEPPSPTPRPAASVPQPTSPPPAVVPTTAPPPAAGPVTLSFVARNISYNVSEARVRSGATVTVTFRNEDAGVDHDVSFGIAGLGHGHTCTGPCSDQYSFTAPAPGTYAFFCTVHATMTGTLIVDP